MKRRLTLILAALLAAGALLAGGTAHPATAAAEWCDTDPTIPNVAIGGGHYVVHVLVIVHTGDRQAAHEATATARTLADGRTLITVAGPPVPWRVRAYSAPAGYAGGTGDAIHAPGARVAFIVTETRS